MNLTQQFRWSGWLIILIAVLVNGMNVLVYLGYHNALIQSVYGVGFTGLIFACTMIHIAQSRRSGILGLAAFLVSVLSLFYANVLTFLTLAELSGIEQARQTAAGIWIPVMRTATYGTYLGLILLGISIAQSGVFPRWAGILVAMGVTLQLPAQYAMEIAGSLFYLLSIGGSILLGTGLAWIAWAMSSERGWNRVEAGLSSLDRKWGGPFLIMTGVLLAVDAGANMLGQLSLTSAITHVLSYTSTLLASYLLFTAFGERVRWTGFVGLMFTLFGSALYISTAYLILAQLAGAIDNNRMLMASWSDIPIGRVGSYLTTLGVLLLGIEAVRSDAFPRGAGWLVITGIVLALPFQFTIQAYFLGIFWVLGALLEGIGIVWMGSSLLYKNQPHPAPQLNETPP